jgi:DNA-binding GntR family transcriptional regulator
VQVADPANPQLDLGPRIHRTTIPHAVTERIRSLILQGRFPPGARLRQVDLAEELGISTTPVREALQQLTAEGLLDAHPHRGVAVHRRTRDELLDLYEMRIALEPIALRAVVDRITPEEMSTAALLVTAMEREASLPTWCEMNGLFHKLIDRSCRRPLLIASLAKLRDVSTIYIAGSIQNDPDRMRIGNDEHRQLLAALKSGDLKAAEQTERAHLEHTLKLGLAYLQLSAEPGHSDGDVA